jgi:NAD(P)-dependent dehydrogenase (short-subunit alcohol dehydrogenase family)
MNTLPYRSALIIGTGLGLSAALTRQLTRAGVKVAVASRNVAKLTRLMAETGAVTFNTDATDPESVCELFDDVHDRIGVPEIVVYNAVQQPAEISAFGGFLIVQQATKRLLPGGKGAILLTGASAKVSAFDQASAFAMGKFGLRGLAQSAAQELSPKGIHVAHFVIDGATPASVRTHQPASTPDADAIARSHIDALCQPRGAWSWEVDLRTRVGRY